MTQTKNLEIQTKTELKKDDIVVINEKHYRVIFSRKLVPFLGEAEGFFAELQEVLQ